ncbi:MAG: hypothetical protein P8H56_06335 [Crocinitomicaceae bacterium]|nr:hypothetical protein [Crocinitomicaceae bacterium]MDG1658180.1 hypothetical protein [Crocinitomicaceae bacterium]
MQTFLVITVVSLAVSYIGWEVYKRFFAKNSKCDSCAMGSSINEAKAD